MPFPIQLKPGGHEYSFCPSMVLKDPESRQELQRLFGICLAAYQSGVMPNEGGLLDQSAEFIDIFVSFIMDFKITELSFIMNIISGMFKKGK